MTRIDGTHPLTRLAEEHDDLLRRGYVLQPTRTPRVMCDGQLMYRFTWRRRSPGMISTVRHVIILPPATT